MEKILITSESVTEGHPDKLCDQISDSILDEFIRQDPHARIAVETMISDNLVVIAGEISAKAQVDLAAVARQILQDVGYTSDEIGIDAKQCLIITNINRQSSDIARGVNSVSSDGAIKKERKNLEDLGAGDQGMMYGFACRETADYLPLPLCLAHKLAKTLAVVRKEGVLPYLRPDGKAQVTVEYDGKGKITALDTIVLSAQHDPQVTLRQLQQDLLHFVIEPNLPASFNKDHLKLHINPTGRFVVGGPKADTGLTGRKIMVDTYGGFARHGGGAFSGKDPTKVDRSAAYMARYAAKNVVAAGFADKCEIGVAYAIGIAEPVAITVECFGTEKIAKNCLYPLIKDCFNFKPGEIIENLHLRQPIYRAAAVYGHFGQLDAQFPWENLDKIALLKKRLNNITI